MIGSTFENKLEYTQIDLTKIDTTTIDLKAKATASRAPTIFPLRIAAGETVVLTYHLTVLPKVVPGTYPLLLIIRMTADDGREGILAPASSVSIGVLGESDIVKLLGVPSFLFLPGFLIIVWQMLWPIGKTDQQGPPFSLTVNSAEFWTAAQQQTGTPVANLLLYQANRATTLLGLLSAGKPAIYRSASVAKQIEGANYPTA